MAKFKDSGFGERSSPTLINLREVTETQPVTPSVSQLDVPTSDVRDRTIGSIISETRSLTADQVEMILAYQRQNGVRFGEAAVALNLVSKDDVLFALSQQFHYPYAPENERKLNPALVALNAPFSVQAESFRVLRSQLTSKVFGDPDQRRALAICSADRADGRSFLAANLAITLAQLGARTILVDADLRNPKQHELFRLKDQSGLSSVLSGRAESNVIQQIDSVPELFVLPVGVPPPNPLELVERPAFGLLIRELLAKFDHVVVDTPAAKHGADCTVIAARCKAAMLVARRNKTQASGLQEIVAGLAGGNFMFAGVVMNEY